MKNKVKKKLYQGEQVKGCFVGIHSPAVVEMLGYSGFDFVVIDKEHGSLSPRDVEDMVKAAVVSNMTPFVRIGYNPNDIQISLDCGAQGIHVPMINSKEDAEKVIERAKFPPIGNRGTAYSVRSAKYGGLKGRNYLDEANEDTFVVLQIETKRAVHNIEAIMDVQGIDLCFIGTTDLAVSMGYADEGPTHPEVQRAIDHVITVGKQKGVLVGKYVHSGKDFKTAFEMGTPYGVIAATAIMMKAFKETVKDSEELNIH